MTEPAHSATRAGAGGAPVDDASDVFAVVAWLAQHHGQAYSKSALTARLPLGSGVEDPGALARALEAVGLQSTLIERKVSDIDASVLPCVVFRGSDHPVVLLAVDRADGSAAIIEPHKGPATRQLPLKDLAAQAAGGVLLAAPARAAATARSDPSALHDPVSTGHWFWSAVRGNWGAWAQVLIAALCVNILGLALPIFVMNVYDRVIPNLAFVTLTTLAIGVVIALVLDLALRTLRANVLEAIGRRVDLTVAARLFRQAMAARLTERKGGAAGIANTIRDFEVVREFFASATFVSVIDLLFIGVFIAVLYVIVGPLAIVPLVAVPLVLVIAVLAQLPIGRSAAEAQQLATKRHVVLVESLIGVATIKSLNAEPTMQREWENAVAAASRINGRTRFWSTVASNAALVIQQGVSVAIIVWGVFLVADGRITIGALIAANILAGRVLAPLGTVAQTLFRAQYAFKSLAALDRFMDLPRDGGNTVRSDARVVRGEITLRGVSYSYPGAPTPAVAGLDLSIAPGEVVALLGRVGSGKTTVGRLMNGLLQPDSGTLLLDGTAISQFDPAEVRDGIGYLPQDPELFTGTLRENLVIGAPRASDADITAALQNAGMADCVAQNPHGLDLFIGEKGNRLSGGQRQGLSLARLLLRRTRMLFLDEPTNAMDQQMEATVTARLKELSAGGTGLILCTHRQSLAAIADRFVVMDRARIVLDGPRDEVIETLRKSAQLGRESRDVR